MSLLTTFVIIAKIEDKLSLILYLIFITKRVSPLHGSCESSEFELSFQLLLAVNINEGYCLLS